MLWVKHKNFLIQQLLLNMNPMLQKQLLRIFLLQLEEQLKAYFAKELQSFSLPLVLSGTPFQKEVWNYLLTIPYGETRSYKQQAEAIDKPQSFRAVANANGKNHISILIPCHRVISSDGSLAGYGGGITRKEFLLNLEKN